MERFWKFIKKTKNGCWNYAGNKNNGYGSFWHNGRNIGAHRFSWQLHYGEIPKGLMVCHHCDNPSCVRPDHLFIGTSKDNMLDASRKGRVLRNQQHGEWKISDEAVARIRKLRGKIMQKDLAKRYGVSRIWIGRIQRNEVRLP